MRLFSLLLVGAVGCGYPYDQVSRVDTGPMPDVPLTGCNVVDQTGCASGACQADVDAAGLVDAMCHPAGSSNAGGYCADHSFCGNTLACWDDRDGSGDGRCYQVCFGAADCNVGTRCDTAGFSATFAGRTVYRCVPEGS